MADGLFVIAELAFIAFGAAAFFHPYIRSLSIPARISVAFLAGSLAFTIEATLLSLVGIGWNVWTIAIPLLAVNAVLAAMWRRGATIPSAPSIRIPPWITISGTAVAIIALANFGIRLVTGRSVSPDYVLFWAVKATRFAATGGIEHELLTWIFGTHLHPNYPPLYPVTLAWGGLLLGDIPWAGAVLTSLVWLIVMPPLIAEFLKPRWSAGYAFAVSAFWTTAMAVSLAYSLSGGNAEAMLLAFVTCGVAALLVEERESGTAPRVVAGLALAGAVLTKHEGMFAWAFLLPGVIGRDLLWRKKGWLRRLIPIVVTPLAAYAVWFTFELVYGIPLRDATREPGWAIHLKYFGATMIAVPRFLNAGTFWLAWIVPVVVIATMARSRLRLIGDSLPAWTLAFGLILITTAYYLHASIDPTALIEWTLPRLAQPALSAWILGWAVLMPREVSGRATEPREAW